MKVLVYAHTFGRICRGLTNQLIYLFNHLILAHDYFRTKRCRGVVFIDKFYLHHQDDRLTSSFSNIINITELCCNHFPNLFVYDIHEMPNGMRVMMQSPNGNNIQLPIHSFVSLIAENSNIFKLGVPDIEPGKPKKFILISTNDSEPSTPSTIELNERNGCVEFMPWTAIKNYNRMNRNDMNSDIIRKILSEMQFHRLSIPRTICSIKSGKCSVVHLRNEKDAIDWWSKENKMTPVVFERILNQKYIQLTRENIAKDETIILLTSRTVGNPVGLMLQSLGYTIYIHDKKHRDKRELNAIHDLMVAETFCNSVLICPAGGSTFGHLLTIRLGHKYEKLVSFDILNIHS